MSRSYKKRPAGGTNHESEKDDKRILNRSMRRQSKQLINKYAETDEDLVLPIKDEVLSKRDMSKDSCGWYEVYPNKWEKTYWEYYKYYLMK